MCFYRHGNIMLMKQEKMMAILLVVVMSCVTLVAGTNFQACGSALTDILSLVCQNSFNGPSKRSYIHEMDKSDIHLMKGVAVHQPQKRGGVVEECCFTSCSIQNLLLYCSQGVRNPFLSSGDEPLTTTTRAPTTARKAKLSNSNAVSGTAAPRPWKTNWQSSRRWFYIPNRFGRFRTGRRSMNMK